MYLENYYDLIQYILIQASTEDFFSFITDPSPTRKSLYMLVWIHIINHTCIVASSFGEGGLFLNKAVLEPIVSPAFEIKYFCYHCNIRFENTSKYMDTVTLFSKTWTKGHWSQGDLWPNVCWGHMCDSTQGSLCPSSMGIDQWMSIHWSILQNTTYTHTTYIHTPTVHTYYVQNEWSHRPSLLLNTVQARQKCVSGRVSTIYNSSAIS